MKWGRKVCSGHELLQVAGLIHAPNILHSPAPPPGSIGDGKLPVT